MFQHYQLVHTLQFQHSNQQIRIQDQLVLFGLKQLLLIQGLFGQLKNSTVLQNYGKLFPHQFTQVTKRLYTI